MSVCACTCLCRLIWPLLVWVMFSYWGATGAVATSSDEDDALLQDFDPIYDPAFNLTDIAAQLAYEEACDLVSAEYGLLHPVHGDLRCPMREFRLHLERNGEPFPVRKSARFRTLYVNFVEYVVGEAGACVAVVTIPFHRRVLPEFRDDVGLDPNGDIVWVRLSFRTTVEWQDPATTLLTDYDRWNEFVAMMNARVRCCLVWSRSAVLLCARLSGLAGLKLCRTRPRSSMVFTRVPRGYAWLSSWSLFEGLCTWPACWRVNRSSLVCATLQNRLHSLGGERHPGDHGRLRCNGRPTACV